jgi:hypothetical protein
MTTTEPEARWHTEPLDDGDTVLMPGETDDDHDEVGADDGMAGVLIDEDPQETDDDG